MSDNDQSKALIKVPSSALVRINKQLELTNKLLALSLDQKMIDSFVEYSSLFIKLISRYYPFKVELIEKYSDQLIWEELCFNEHIIWNESLIEKYSHKWNSFIWINSRDKVDLWAVLSFINNVNWSDNLIDKYKDRWDWKRISGNVYIPWTDQLIIKYESKWEWQILFNNNEIFWDENLLSKYTEKLNLSPKECLCPDEIGNIEIYRLNTLDDYSIMQVKLKEMKNVLAKRNRYWTLLSQKKNVCWSEELLYKYQDNWDWKSLSKNKNLP